MNADFVPFLPAHLDAIEVQARHAHVLPTVRIRPFAMQDAEDSPWSFTMLADGRPVACVGVNKLGCIWAFVAHDARPHMLALTRFGRAMMDAYRQAGGRLWAEIDPTHPEAVRWAKLGGMVHVSGERWEVP